MTFRIAVVQPISHRPGDDERNVADAVRTIERAAGAAKNSAHRIALASVKLEAPIARPSTARRSNSTTPPSCRRSTAAQAP